MANKKTDKAGGAETLLVELLTEELPPKALQRLSQAFCDSLVEDLRQDSLLANNSQAKVFATPRRLAVSISYVLTKAPDKPVEISGPSVNVGLDSAGKPTPALVGFARKNGVAVDELVQVDTPKGKVFACRKVASGTHLETNLQLKIEEALKEALKGLPGAKKMRWGSGVAEFVRPVQGLVMLHGSRVIPGNVLGAESTNKILGHRFLSVSEVTLKHADDYEDALKGAGKVIADFAVRRSEISKQLEKAAGGAKLVINDTLLDEVTAIVENPVVYAGVFSDEFLAVPEECLILSMQQHQKYVPLRDKANGKLLPRFLFVSNIPAKDPGDIIHGNERVLNARLSDAKFFYDQDRKTRLDARVPRLANVVYVNKLGSQLDRVERIKKLAVSIARELKADAAATERAAWLSKADLLTDMVGEFPELQGVMGRYYALHGGEPKEVANAIEQHYRPRFSGDELPKCGVATAVALAEKMDGLVGIFGVGQAPTGDRDPFALRRAALGAVRIIAEQRLPLTLEALISDATSVYGSALGQAEISKVRPFLLDRMRSYLRDLGYRAEEIEAVVEARIDRVLPVIKAVRDFTALPEAASLAGANKRIRNILRQQNYNGTGSVDESLLNEPAERALFDEIRRVSPRIDTCIQRGEFTDALCTMASLKNPVDTFFDKILVNAEDERLRKNRLALLADLSGTMNQLADISKLAA